MGTVDFGNAAVQGGGRRGSGMMAWVLAWLWHRTGIITLADRARDSGRSDRAARLYRNALRRNPKQPAIWVQYGHVLKDLGDLERAEAAYRRAVGHDPTNHDAQLQLGHLLKLRRRMNAAELAYLRSLALDQAADQPLAELKTLGWSDPELAELKLLASLPAFAARDGASPEAG
jgi:tetratricopeptide (TPR) repeat protein